MDNDELAAAREFGAVIADLRHIRGLRQDELAVRLHISRSYVNELESGRRVPGLSSPLQGDLTRALELSVEEQKTLRGAHRLAYYTKQLAKGDLPRGAARRVAEAVVQRWKRVVPKRQRVGREFRRERRITDSRFEPRRGELYLAMEVEAFCTKHDREKILVNVVDDRGRHLIKPIRDKLIAGRQKVIPVYLTKSQVLGFRATFMTSCPHVEETFVTYNWRMNDDQNIQDLVEVNPTEMASTVTVPVVVAIDQRVKPYIILGSMSDSSFVVDLKIRMKNLEAPFNSLIVHHRITVFGTISVVSLREMIPFRCAICRVTARCADRRRRIFCVSEARQHSGRRLIGSGASGAEVRRFIRTALAAPELD